MKVVGLMFIVISVFKVSGCVFYLGKIVGWLDR